MVIGSGLIEQCHGSAFDDMCRLRRNLRRMLGLRRFERMSNGQISMTKIGWEYLSVLVLGTWSFVISGS